MSSQTKQLRPRSALSLKRETADESDANRQVQREKISVDQLLESQIAPTALRATIEAVTESPDSIKITPWVSGRGCLCQLAIVIPKSSVASVTPTEATHVCCGKTLRVVEVNFASNESISLEELFAQLNASALKSPSRERASGILDRFPAPMLGTSSRPFQRARHAYGPRFTPQDHSWMEHCGMNYAECLARCYLSSTQSFETCECLCKQELCFCSWEHGRVCVPQECPVDQ